MTDTALPGLGMLTALFRLSDVVEKRIKHTAICEHMQDHQCLCVCGEYDKERARIVAARLCCAVCDPCPVHR